MRRPRAMVLALCLGGCGDNVPTDGVVPVDPDPVSDMDQDGYDASEDCDDADATVHPDATEICDGIDNDCDLAIDDADGDLQSDLTFFPDADSDGFGTDAGGVTACVPPEGYVATPGDCDDQRSDVHPAAIEVCGGATSDCDPTTEPVGVAFRDTLQVLSDRTPQFAVGTPIAPIVVPLSTDGTLSICSGTWYAGLDISADVVVAGGGSAFATLDGASVGTGIRVGNGASVDISGLTLARFAPNSTIWVDVGGGLSVLGASQVTATDLVFLDHLGADYGGAVSVDEESALTLSDSTFQGNQATIGGHLYVGSGTATLTNVAFRAGLGTLGGGAVLLGDAITELPAALLCEDCVFENNSVDVAVGNGWGGGIWVLWNAVLTLDGGAFEGNRGGGGGGAVALEGYGSNSVVDFDAVYFDANLDEIGPNDVAIPTLGLRYDYSGTTQSATCLEQTGCF